MNHIIYQHKKVAYQLEGEGKLLVLLHGFCEDQSFWDEFKVDLLSTHQILTLDLPGFGQSEVPEQSSIAYMANAVQAVVEHINWKQFTLIGHSMGGYVTLAFAHHYPQYLNGIGLFHSHCFEDSAEKKAARLKSIDFVSANGSAPYVKQVIPSLFASDYFIQNAPLINQLVEKASKYSPEGIINALQAMHDKTDQSDLLKAITIPVLFIIGKKDLVTPYELCIKQTHYPATASIQVLENVGHMGMFEEKENCQKIIVDFIEFCEQQNTVEQ
jgi:pimeloyl-ACP methyl ester carboxylesterase